MNLVKVGTFIMLLTLTTVCIAHADLGIIWNTDTDSAFDVAVSGTGVDTSNPDGVAGCHTTITSPSGLWRLSIIDTATYPAPYLPDRVNIYNQGKVWYLGTLSPDLPPYVDDPMFPYWMVTQGYNDYLIPSVPLQDGSGWNMGYLHDTIGWGGYCPFVITSMPDLNDPSTWTWTSEYSASGPALAPVPEAGTLSLLLTGSLLLATQRIRGLAKLQV